MGRSTNKYQGFPYDFSYGGVTVTPHMGGDRSSRMGGDKNLSWGVTGGDKKFFIARFLFHLNTLQLLGFLDIPRG